MHVCNAQHQTIRYEIKCNRQHAGVCGLLTACQTRRVKAKSAYGIRTVRNASHRIFYLHAHSEACLFECRRCVLVIDYQNVCAPEERKRNGQSHEHTAHMICRTRTGRSVYACGPTQRGLIFGLVALGVDFLANCQHSIY